MSVVFFDLNSIFFRFDIHISVSGVRKSQKSTDLDEYMWLDIRFFFQLQIVTKVWGLLKPFIFWTKNEWDRPANDFAL